MATIVVRKKVYRGRYLAQKLQFVTGRGRRIFRMRVLASRVGHGFIFSVNGAECSPHFIRTNEV